MLWRFVHFTYFLLKHLILEHSTIIYEDPQHHPLLRLGWNKQDPNYLATMVMDAMEVCTYHIFLTKTLNTLLEHSTIIYEDPQHHPLLRLGWNKQDPNYLATMAMDAMEVSTYYIFLRKNTLIHTRALHYHLRGPTTPPTPQARLEQARSKLSRYHGDGCYGGLYILHISA